MFFSRKPQKVGTYLGRQQTLSGFLFNPNFGKNIASIGNKATLFVRIIAMLFASNGLFPKNHPALAEDSGLDLSLSDVVGTAYHSLAFTRDDLPRAVLFFAVLGALAFSVLMAATLLLIALSGSAHAADTGCSGGIFDPCSTSDLAYQWLGYLFQNGTIVDSQGFVAPQDTFIRNGLTAALKLYSSAFLVLAGIILMYHLLSMVVNTAHTGKPMGSANQIWAPIRLVVAVALLIPISSTGLNLGQGIAVQVAQWGSGLASHVWSAFLGQIESSTKNDLVVMPKTPSLNLYKVVQDLAYMKACAILYNYHVVKMADVLGDNVSTTNIVKKTKTAGGSYGNLEYPLACGSWQNPKSTSSDQLVSSIYSAYSSFNASLLENSDIDELASRIAYSFVAASSSSTKVLSSDDTTLLNSAASTAGVNVTIPANPDPITLDAVTKVAEKLRTDANTKLEDISVSSVQTAVSSLVSKISADGWVSAGSIFNTITRIQSHILDANDQALLRTEPPSVSDLRESFLYSYSAKYENTGLASVGMFGGIESPATYRPKATADENKQADQFVAALGTYRHSMQNSVIDPMVAGGFDSSAQDAGWGGGLVDKALGFVDELGIKMALWPSGGGIIHQFTSTNPLAELARLGHQQMSSGLTMIVVGAGSSLASSLIALIPVPWISAFSTPIQALGGLSITIGAALLVLGISLSFFIPMMPFLYFFFNIVEWLMVVFEAVVCAPLLALAHLNPNGEGLPGPSAKTGYTMLFSIMLRPMFCVLGLMVGFLVFCLAVMFLNRLFVIAAIGTTSFGAFPGWSKLIFSLIYVFMVYMCADTCFKMIDHLPDVAMNWFGGQTARADGGSPASVITKAEPIATGLLGRSVAEGLNKTAGAVGGGVSSYVKNKQQLSDQKKTAEGVAGRHQETLAALGASGGQAQLPASSPPSQETQLGSMADQVLEKTGWADTFAGSSDPGRTSSAIQSVLSENKGFADTHFGGDTQKAASAIQKEVAKRQSGAGSTGNAMSGLTSSKNA